MFSALVIRDGVGCIKDQKNCCQKNPRKPSCPTMPYCDCDFPSHNPPNSGSGSSQCDVGAFLASVVGLTLNILDPVQSTLQFLGYVEAFISSSGLGGVGVGGQDFLKPTHTELGGTLE